MSVNPEKSTIVGMVTIGVTSGRGEDLPDVQPFQGLADIINGEVVRERLLVRFDMALPQVLPRCAAANTRATSKEDAQSR